MKIAIFTLNGNVNYGNRLQNYALQEVISNLGFEVETVLNMTENTKNKNLMEKISTKFSNSDTPAHRILMEEVGKLFSKVIFGRKNGRLMSKRIRRFEEFSKHFINETDYIISDSSIPSTLGNEYDFYVTGSDQVWNPYWRQGSPIDFLAFAPREKRIAYAPSFGVSSIPVRFREIYRQYLEGIDHLSIREKEGRRIIEDLTGKKVPIVLDPTALLPKEKWLQLSKSSEIKPQKGYVVTYFLNSPTGNNHNKIEQYAKEHDFELVELNCIEDSKYYDASPQEFIDFIANSEMLFTDSFHGAVFALILEKDFVVLPRNSSMKMESRIDTLLENFGLQDRKLDSIRSTEAVDSISPIDRDSTRETLEELRDSSLRFLKDSLNID